VRASESEGVGGRGRESSGLACFSVACGTLATVVGRDDTVAAS
jgi:hypothetical protein